MDFEDTSREDLKQSLTIEIDVAKSCEYYVHCIEVCETFNSNETSFVSCLVSMYPYYLAVTKELLAGNAVSSHSEWCLYLIWI